MNTFVFTYYRIKLLNSHGKPLNAGRLMRLMDYLVFSFNVKKKVPKVLNYILLM